MGETFFRNQQKKGKISLYYYLLEDLGFRSGLKEHRQICCGVGGLTDGFLRGNGIASARSSAALQMNAEEGGSEEKSIGCRFERKTMGSSY